VIPSIVTVPLAKVRAPLLLLVPTLKSRLSSGCPGLQVSNSRESQVPSPNVKPGPARSRLVLKFSQSAVADVPGRTGMGEAEAADTSMSAAMLAYIGSAGRKHLIAHSFRGIVGRIMEGADIPPPNVGFIVAQTMTATRATIMPDVIAEVFIICVSFAGQRLGRADLERPGFLSP
jgi:hypothetical protein